MGETAHSDRFMPWPQDIPDATSVREMQQEIARLRLEVENYQRAFSESNHRIANSLQLLSLLLKSQRRTLSDSALADILSHAESRILSIAQLHRHLYKNGVDTTVDLSAFLNEFQEEISESYGLDCIIKAERVKVRGALAAQLVIAINELVLNALKHGYEGKRGGVVLIGCETDREGNLQVMVADRGIGLPQTFDADTTTGLGLSVVRSILDQFGGSLRAANRGGAVFTMSVPMKGN